MKSYQNPDSVSSDIFLYHSRDPHTAIPDWLVLCRTISIEARSLALTIIVMSKGALPPTKPELAESLGVDVRSVYRWLNELSTAGIMHTNAVGRRNLYIFHESKCDTRITDPSISDTTITFHESKCDTRITDPSITDPGVRHDAHDRDQFLAHQDDVNGDFSENSITDRPVGVGVDQHVSDSDSPTTNRAPLKTELARWLKRAGMNAAREFDDPALDYATYREFVEYKRSLGWEWRQIVSTLREAPLTPGEQAPPLDPAAYDPGFALGSQAPPLNEPESIGDHARRILPPDASTADWVFIQSQLVRHVSEAGALLALEQRRTAVRR